MSKRERILAGMMGGLLLLLVVGYGLNKLYSVLRTKRQDVLALQDQIRDKQRISKFGMQDRERLDGYEAMSLPSDSNKARSEYQKWLMGVVNETARFSEPDFSVLKARSDNETYQMFVFEVTGQGSLPQLVDFLYHFYSADILHRIRRFYIKRIPNSKQLDITISIDALALKNAPNDRVLENIPAHQLIKGGKADYLAAILERNLSGLANNPPELESPGTRTAYTNESFNFPLAARDSDSLDRLKYQLEGDEIFGAAVDEETGEFEWTPEKPGEYQFVVLATDDGIPARVARETFQVNVTDKPESEPADPDKPSFDMAQFAFLTGITEATNGRRQAWVTLRTDGKKLKLIEGDQFQVGDVTVTVRQIGERTVVMDADVLELSMRVRLGQNLAESEMSEPGSG